MADFTPRILAGRYEVGELIGRGGMAEVHVGRDARLGRTVAIKLLRSDLARDPSFQTRFRREAQAAASLNHPAVVSVYDTGEDVVTDANGGTHHFPFIIMEYVEGHTLRELMHDGAALPIDEATDITIGVLSALQYAHHAGIVHRDIKPGNIMLTVSGQVKVMDFGIARALAETSEAVTQTQAVIGTAQYLSPEQARGETVDARSDLYSTGCVLFELLTGRPPFQGDSAVSVAYQHVREHAVPPSTYAPDVPQVLDQIVLKALTKDRDHRYSTASEFLADLQSSKRGGRVSAPPVGIPVGDATQVLGGTSATTMAAVPPAMFPPSLPTSNTQAFGNAGILPESGDVAADEAAAKRKRTVLISVIAGVVALVLIIVVIFALRPKSEAGPDPSPSPTAEQVPVPSLDPDKRTVPDAEALLRKHDFEPEQGTPENHDTVPKGMVIRFDPESGQLAPKGSTVQYIVSLGKAETTVPEVAGKTPKEAGELLEEVGLVVNMNQESVNHPKVPKGRVVETDPPANTPVSKGDEVTLKVSNGMTVVPSCVGKTQDVCSNEISDAGLKLGSIIEDTNSDQPKGVVTRLDPGEKQTVKQKDPVNVYISTGSSDQTVKIIPNVQGKQPAAARADLEAMGFSVTETQGYSPEIPAGQVIGTNPAAGGRAAVGSNISLIVSLGKDPNGP
ncbi:MAG: Stk1 family PASTA domain-containing Ser/Thr kinase [Bifidobacteriaceae bacterium]|nr:Stk1 family PASTA domain-containing Ser/Thr kinase [Bifidobacteriaceae bacterium]